MAALGADYSLTAVLVAELGHLSPEVKIVSCLRKDLDAIGVLND